MAFHTIESPKYLHNMEATSPGTIALQLTTETSPALSHLDMTLGLYGEDSNPYGVVVSQNGHIDISEKQSSFQPDFTKKDKTPTEIIAPIIRETTTPQIGAVTVYLAGKWVVDNQDNQMSAFRENIAEYSPEELENSKELLYCFDSFYRVVAEGSTAFFGPRPPGKKLESIEQRALKLDMLTSTHVMMWEAIQENCAEFDDRHLVYALASNDLNRSSESLFDSPSNLQKLNLGNNQSYEKSRAIITATMRQRADVMRRVRVIDDIRGLLDLKTDRPN